MHRWSGRVYVAACLPASVCTTIIAPMTLYGANQRVANFLLGALWFLTTAAGYRAIRERRFADHREWMLRSVALAFSIVANRLWVMVTLTIMTPEMFAGAEVDPVQLNQGVGVASWLSGW